MAFGASTTARFIISLLVARQALAAAQESSRPTFEAASVKPSTSSGAPRLIPRAASLSASNVTLRMLVRNAYGVQEFQISGGQGWMDRDLFNVEATADAPTTPDRLRAMTRTLLQDRFKLVTHTETHELPIYVLTVARRDGKLGDRINEAGTECQPMKPFPGAPPPASPIQAPPPGAPCPSMLALGGISGRRLPINRLIATLSQFVGRQIIDSTNLTGMFDFDLEWTPDQIPNGGRGPIPVAPFDPNGPSLFTALQEQLGLKLEPSRGSVEFVVIDSAEKPSAD